MFENIQQFHNLARQYPQNMPHTIGGLVPRRVRAVPCLVTCLSPFVEKTLAFLRRWCKLLPPSRQSFGIQAATCCHFKRSCREKRSQQSQQSVARPHPRLSRPHGHQERPRRHQPPPRQGPPALDHFHQVKPLPVKQLPGQHPVTRPAVPRPAPPGPVGRLRRVHRLQHKREFDGVFADGRRAYGPHLLVVAAPVQDPPGLSRLGLAVSRGTGHAPARARLRRLLREAFRSLRPHFRHTGNLVISVRQPWSKAHLAEVIQELSMILKRLRLTA